MWRFLGLEGASQDGTGRMVSLGGRQLRLQRVMAEGGHATIYEARERTRVRADWFDAIHAGVFSDGRPSVHGGKAV
ncbi:hypothetical protein EMIHUDRAFT_235196 [Emiliania huxleyi CCMP1516]|uniref:Uncharacterized protein n=2 Tax=Emiliania huxleyi TaxID=2903 RepID=A0A0D3JX73_EMIH1|nr:hypothetical protein EMIHUDRAFT_235196 [Emiliania huxleyi CCMP1516]EOD28108.1 hypothetical protein EMIHUDRAFT_235196 [Emiliania huxleyi CCMP1516]|eukprot:XP_005780537.1 hypothetical protein EMIHUDRAFT_235196 [Emiliania huxleyi CCMP1516]